MKRSRLMPILVIPALAAGYYVLGVTPHLGAQPRTPHGSTVQASDRTFMMKAAAGGREEVELGRLAQKHASNDAVRRFGQRMVADHAKANQELRDLATSKGVDLPEKAVQHDSTGDRLALLRGQEFDRQYVNDMVRDHKRDVAEFRHMQSTVSDPDVKAWIDKTLPTLEDHLKTIEGIHAQMASAQR